MQSKLGTTKFANVYNQIRQKVISVQRDRKTARALQVATNPQFTAKRKMHKNANKKESKKRKNAEFGSVFIVSLREPMLTSSALIVSARFT